MAQFLRPDSNVTQANFTGGFAEIDEATASNADYAWGDDDTVAVLEVGLSNPSGVPGVGTTTFRWRGAKVNQNGNVVGAGGDVTVTPALIQGTTVLATGAAETVTGTWIEFTFTPDPSGVTDWNDLRLRFTTSDGAVLRGGAVSWAELEVPNAGVAGTLSKTLETATLSAAAALAIAGALTASLGSLSLVSDASVSDSPGAVLNTTLGGIGLVAEATLPINGVADATLASVSLFGEGFLPLDGTANITLGEAAAAGEGSLVFTASTPEFKIRSILWNLERPATRNISGWTGSRTIVAEPWRGKWRASVELAPIHGAEDMGAMRAFLATRQGTLFPFRIAATEGPQNANTGVSVASTANAGSTSMDLSGYQTPLLDGHYATVNGQLLLLTEDQAGDEINFEPKLREDAEAGTIVVTSEPYALVHLANSRVGWGVDLGRFYSVAFDVEEAMLEPDGSPPEWQLPPIAATLSYTLAAATLVATGGEYVGYALALPFSTSDDDGYWVDGTDYAAISAVPGYAYVRAGAKREIDDVGGTASFAADVPGIIPDIGYWSRGPLTNRLHQSQSLENWSALSGAVVTPNVALAPSGLVTADELRAGAGGGSAFPQAVNSSPTFTTGGVKTWGIFVKAAGTPWIRLRTTGYIMVGVGATALQCFFHLVGPGSTANPSAGATPRIVNIGNGWYWCAIEAELDGTDLQGSFVLHLAAQDGSTSVPLDGVAGVYAWEGGAYAATFGTKPPPIITTAGAAATVNADDLAVSAALPAGDFIAWAVLDLAGVPTATVRPFAYSTAGAGSALEHLYFRMFSSGSVELVVTAGGAAQSVPGASANIITAGRIVILARRAAGAYSFAVKKADDTIVISAAGSAASVPAATTVEIGADYDGDSQLNGVVEGFFQRDGTFDNAAVTAILEAA